MNVRLFVKTIWATVLFCTSVAAFGSAPAQAELVQPPAPEWGLDQFLPSTSMGNWDSLGFAVEYTDGLVIVGGRFGQLTNGSQTLAQPYLAAFDSATQTPLSWWRPTLNGTVLALENSSDGAMFVGGDFGSYNGNTIGGFAKIDPASGKVWPGWNTRVYGGSNTIRDIRLESDGWLYVVGNFTTASDGGGPQTVNGAVRMNPVTGAIDWTWLPQPSGGGVWGVARSLTTNEVYLAGWFTSVNGDSAARGFAGVSSVDGSLLHSRSTIPYNTCVNCTGYWRLYDVVATSAGDVWVGGEQHGLFILEESQNLAMREMHYTGCNPNYQANCQRAGGEFQEIELVGDRIYATCHCWGSHMSSNNTIFHGSPPPNPATYTYTGSVSAIAAYDVATGDRIQAFNPYMSGDAGGFGIVGAPDGCLWVTGGISSYGVPGTQQPARDLVRLCDQAGPGTNPDAPPSAPAPLNCVATLSGDGATATLTYGVPALATDVVLHRQLNNIGSFSWRGKVTAPAATFSEAVPQNSLINYQATAKYPLSQFSEPTPCAPTIDTNNVGDPVVPPASCTASAVNLAATISYPAVVGATDYRIYRSIDGGATYWRGAVQTTSFNDTLVNGASHHYSVQAKVGGTWSTSRDCTPDLVGDAGGPPVVPPASCTATAVGPAATVTWTSVVGATDYRVYRTVNGGPAYWRGAVQTTSFNDSLVNGGIHHYTVQAKVGGVWSTSADCSPDLVG